MAARLPRLGTESLAETDGGQPKRTRHHPIEQSGRKLSDAAGRAAAGAGTDHADGSDRRRRMSDAFQHGRLPLRLHEVLLGIHPANC